MLERSVLKRAGLRDRSALRLASASATFSVGAGFHPHIILHFSE